MPLVKSFSPLYDGSHKRMREQPIPVVTSSDVERVVRRDFPEEQFATVMDILNEYGATEWERERPRVQLAVLKLAGGTLQGLRSRLQLAKADYRDVIGPAEYPAYVKRLFRMPELPVDEQQQIIENDWKQYEAWLRTES
jgi:hypothetical protein